MELELELQLEMVPPATVHCDHHMPILMALTQITTTAETHGRYEAAPSTPTEQQQLRHKNRLEIELPQLLQPLRPRLCLNRTCELIDPTKLQLEMETELQIIRLRLLQTRLSGMLTLMRGWVGMLHFLRYQIEQKTLRLLQEHLLQL